LRDSLGVSKSDAEAIERGLESGHASLAWVFLAKGPKQEDESLKSREFRLSGYCLGTGCE
jgi:hypothetical protein